MASFEVKAYVTFKIPAGAADDPKYDIAEDIVVDALNKVAAENNWTITDLEIK